MGNCKVSLISGWGHLIVKWEGDIVGEGGGNIGGLKWGLGRGKANVVEGVRLSSGEHAMESKRPREGNREKDYKKNRGSRNQPRRLEKCLSS